LLQTFSLLWGFCMLFSVIYFILFNMQYKLIKIKVSTFTFPKMLCLHEISIVLQTRHDKDNKSSHMGCLISIA